MRKLGLIALLFLSFSFYFTLLAYSEPKSTFVTPPPPKGLTVSQQNSWNELQKYDEWLYYRPDFDDFNQAYVKRLNELNITPQQVNAGLYNEVMAKGGDFTIARRHIERWYKSYRTNGWSDFEFELDIIRLSNPVNYSPMRSEAMPSTQTRRQPAGINMGVGNIIMFALLIGTILSILAVFIYNAVIATDTSLKAEVQDDTDTHTPQKDKEYIDLEFSEETPSEDFDYPYEDIGEVLK